MTSLKMENGYDAYISNFEDLVAADNGNCSFVTLKHFYLKGLPGHDARGVSLQQPKTLDELYRVSRLVSRAYDIKDSSSIPCGQTSDRLTRKRQPLRTPFR